MIQRLFDRKRKSYPLVLGVQPTYHGHYLLAMNDQAGGVLRI